MKDYLRNWLDRMEPFFKEGGKLSYLYPLYEAIDTFLYTPDHTTKEPSHVRDHLDLKRIMITVAFALTPAILMALYNTGFQANRVLSSHPHMISSGWRHEIIQALGIGFDPQSVIANLIHGALYFIPIFLVCNIIGGLWEVLFALIRKHEVNEGFLVTGLLFPLTLPPTIPLWQVAVGISFAVVVGKEVFGGTGKNFLNPALTGRAFLFFAYPAQISGDAVWTVVDGYTGATPLGIGALQGLQGIVDHISWSEAFLGTIPGSMGETSALACLFGAVVLLLTGIGSWRIMLSMLVGGWLMASLLQMIGSDTNPMFSVPFYWHLVLGGFAFGLVFMATDPVSAAMTHKGQFIYGALIGVMAILVRTINPAFPEGVMLAILFGNVFAPLIDWFVIQGVMKRRQKRLMARQEAR